MTNAIERAWQELCAHAETLREKHLRALFAEHPRRFEDFSLTAGEILMDFSKQRMTQETLTRLHALAEAVDVAGWRQRMVAGEIINHTENRAVLHMALRAPTMEHDASLPGATGASLAEVHHMLARMRAFCVQLHSGVWRGATGERITDVVNLGIGGSDLGPRMVTRALAAGRRPEPRVHFVSNMDGGDLALCLRTLDAARTLFIVASKTFGTQETLANAHSARAWLEARLPAGGSTIRQHFVAVSSNQEAVAAFGIPAAQTFAFGDWVGGRFSLWSPVGLAIMLAIGPEGFADLLAGARQMDQHFLEAPPRKNLPLTLALLDIWNVNCIGAYSHGIFPYSQSLELFPAYLQQLEMESTGKSVDRAGNVIARKTCPVLWGSSGTNGQHSFFQLLHQGGQPIPSDFILIREADFPLPGHHARLLANGLAQSAALAFGQTAAEARAAGIPERLLPYRTFPGNQPSTTLLLNAITPHTLGSLLALYEHKVFCQGVLWNVNAFDQWGVELGKQMAHTLLPFLQIGDRGSGVRDQVSGDRKATSDNTTANAFPPTSDEKGVRHPQNPETALDASTRGLLAALREQKTKER